MFKGRILRAFVNERLIAAAEEIFALFESTIAEYEEELRRARAENQRRNREELLDPVRPENPKVPLLQTAPLTVNVTWVKDEEERPCAPVPEPVCVKTERRKRGLTVHGEERHGEERRGGESHGEERRGEERRGEERRGEERRGEGRHGETRFHAEAEEIHHYQVQITDRRTVAQNPGGSPENPGGSPENRDVSGQRKTHQCSFCTRRFRKRVDLHRHIRVHTGEKPFSCSVCEKAFSRVDNLNTHQKLHSGDKPFRCQTCEKSFTKMCTLKMHVRQHAGHRPFS